jgi:phenylacetate-CoA ligase
MRIVRTLAWKTRLAWLGDILPNFRQLQEWQWLDAVKTRDLQKNRLERLLIHAYGNVPYYREVLARAGVVDEKGDVRLERFRHIPLLDKATIRKRYPDLKSGDLVSREWRENTSGGSTGEPVRFIQDKGYDAALVAVKMMDDRWTGYVTGDNKIVLWGSERDLFTGRENFRTLLGRWFRGERWLNSFRMTPAQMRKHVEQITMFRPVQILAYAESIYELARFIEREGFTIHSPRAIMTSAGVLQAPMREAIERVFKCPVFNRYGSREVGDIACECDHHKGLHVAAPTQYVEVLKPDGMEAAPGETGEIVITNLTNYAMPLIRYRIGDIGALAAESCTCGRGWPLLKNIMGRVSDTFVTKDGSSIHGEYFTHLFYFKDWIRKFQVIQEDYDRIHIAIVPHLESGGSETTRLGPDREMAELIEKIRFVMGEQCAVSYAFVDEIAPSSSGKYRYTISKLTA